MTMTASANDEQATRASHASDDRADPWEQIGRAAEHFARRVARDACRFAAHLERHAGEFADDVARDWGRFGRDYRRGCRHSSPRASQPEVRRVFEDIRTVLTDVLEGVDELIDRVFAERTDPGEHPGSDWTRVVTNRSGKCAACDRDILSGDEAFLRRTAAGMEFRCLACDPRPKGEGSQA
jgi:hypothetical protein